MELTVHVPEGHDSIGVLGSAERNLKMLRESLGVGVSSRRGAVRLTGDSRLIDAVRRLRGVLGVAVVGFSGRDVVRHKMVQRIVDAYARTDKQSDEQDDGRTAELRALEHDLRTGTNQDSVRDGFDR